MRTKIGVLAEPNSIYCAPFMDYAEVVTLPQRTLQATYELLRQCKLAVFTGGTDIDARMYADTAHPATDDPDTSRDHNEHAAYEYCVQNQIPMVGICRGSQFLTVMNGGRLAQHVTGHSMAGSHAMHTNDGDTIMVTSTHHQMMWLEGIEDRCELLGWADNRSHEYALDSEDYVTKDMREPEVVWFPDTSCLCVQYHPEYMGKDTEGWKYFQKLIQQYVWPHNSFFLEERGNA